MSSEATTLNDLTSTIARAWTWLRRILWTAAGVFAFIVVLEAIHLHELLDSVHPVLAWTVTGALALVLAWLGGRAALRYVRVPRVLAPPDLPPAERGWTAAQRALYVDFALRYLERQSRNPHLDSVDLDRVTGAIATVRALTVTGDDDAAATRPLVETVERELAAVLRPLDQGAKILIRRAAVEVSIATAVSPSILLDSLITLTRNVDLISKLADLYYGRPGLWGTLRVVRDVLGAAVAAGALEVISDNVTSAVSEMTGSWSSRLLGPLGQGAVNGVVTMRLGAAARVRCRSLATPKVPWRPWRLSDYRRGLSRLMDWLSEDVGPRVTNPLGRWFARPEVVPADGPSDLTGTAADSGRERWWRRLFRGRDREDERATSVDEYEQPRDPLLDGDLFE